MRRDRGIWKVESGEGLRAPEKTRFLGSLKGGEGQGPSRFGLSSGLRASESLALPPCSACHVLPRYGELTGSVSHGLVCSCPRVDACRVLLQPACLCKHP